jgi:hypothetical protein
MAGLELRLREAGDVHRAGGRQLRRHVFRLTEKSGDGRSRAQAREFRLPLGQVVDGRRLTQIRTQAAGESKGEDEPELDRGVAPPARAHCAAARSVCRHVSPSAPDTISGTAIGFDQRAPAFAVKWLGPPRDRRVTSLRSRGARDNAGHAGPLSQTCEQMASSSKFAEPSRNERDGLPGDWRSHSDDCASLPRPPACRCVAARFKRWAMRIFSIAPLNSSARSIARPATPLYRLPMFSAQAT